MEERWLPVSRKMAVMAEVEETMRKAVDAGSQRFSIVVFGACDVLAGCVIG